MSFLDDLKQQAAARRREAQGDLAEIERRTAQVEAACATVWRYLDDLGRQLQVLQPVSAARYVFDGRTVVEGLRCTDFAADIRKTRVARGPLAEVEVVERIVLMARMVSGRRIELAKDFPPEIERLEGRLAQAGIQCIGLPIRDAETGRFVENRYAFTADLVAGVRVLPRHEEGGLRFVVQNLDGLVSVEGTLAAHEVSTARLDELARWWVGQPQRFFEGARELRRVEPY
jgi:hypothetical protein